MKWERVDLLNWLFIKPEVHLDEVETESSELYWTVIFRILDPLETCNGQYRESSGKMLEI